MPSAKVIDLGRAQQRRTLRLVRSSGVDQVNGLFRELEAFAEAMPSLREEAETRFPRGENMVAICTVELANGEASRVVAPTAELLAFLGRCRSLAKAKGLILRRWPPPEQPDLARAVEELGERFGIDARLYQVARSLGLPQSGHAHAMGQGVGTL